MLFINLPEAITTRKLSFYLAMEEFVARHFDADDCFFMWRVEPSVIFGRNVMLSYISNGEQVGLAFNRFISMMLLVFRKMGVDAVGTRHNDILIGGRKVCGTACYHLPGKSVVHSTMLYDTNMEHMLNAITPSTEKLQSKGIQSVRQRITLLKDYVPLNIEETMVLIRTTLCSNERTLTLEEVAAIEQLEENYLREEFIYLM